ncbi:MAG: triose-phosphate isomerase [Caldisericia bacterium]|nr:triose-phosphate isomerase [Caldisericia bacterium]
MSRYCIGNWKQNLGPGETIEYCNQMKESLQKEPLHDRVHCVVASPFVSLPYTGELPQNIERAAQNCSSFSHGSYTGEISAAWLSEVGCRYCIIGHSERRQFMKESSKEVYEKYVQLQQNSITPIVCIGENDMSMKDEERLSFIIAQLSLFSSQESFIIAYEPVWAIGTGVIPSLDWIQVVSHNISSKFPSCHVLYGGSVNESNAESIISIPTVQGFLIGGASLDPKKFLAITHIAEDAMNEG